MNKTTSIAKVDYNAAKGEIAHNKQFHLLSQCFQKSSATEVAKVVCYRGGIKRLYVGMG